MQWLEVELQPLSKTYEVGIVLSGIVQGGVVKDDQFQLNESSERLIEAIRLYRMGVIKKILLTGGAADLNYPDINEGEDLRDIALSLSVPLDDIILENKARNTFENAEYSKRLLSEYQGDLLLITSGYHMRRAKACFDKQGIFTTCYPVDFRAPQEFKMSYLLPHVDALRNWNVVIKECVGLIAYKLVGYS